MPNFWRAWASWNRSPRLRRTGNGNVLVNLERARR
jgi:hypothetical protein